MLVLISSWRLLPNRMQRALLSIPTKYTFHLSSSLTSTFSFSFGSAAPQFPSLPCHFAFSCVFWLITVTPHPKACREKSVSSSPRPHPSPPHLRSLISRRKGNLSAKAPGLVCCLSECYFHSLAVFYWGWGMIPTFHTQRWLVWGKQTNRSSNKYSRAVESLFKCRLRFPGKSLLAQ